MRTFVSIGYIGNQNEYTIEKALMGPSWKYLCHTLLQYISQKRSGWHQVSSALASAFHGMVAGLDFNFAHLIFEGLRNNLQEAQQSQLILIPHPPLQILNNKLLPLLEPLCKLLRMHIPHLESQHSDENIKRDSQNIRETSLEVSLLGSGSQPGSVEQPAEPYHYFSSLNLSAEAPSQDDIPSPTTTISEVLIDLAANAPNPSSSPKKVHSSGTDRVNVERAVTTPGISIAQCQENQGDGDAEARPKAPSRSKDSTTVDEDRLKLHNMELTARVAMREAEVSKLRHQVSMHEAHQCPTVPTPSLISVGTQTDNTLCTDATKKGEIVTKEDDADSLEEWIQEQTVFQNEEEDITEDWKLVVRDVDEVLQDETLHEDTRLSFNILPKAATIITKRFWIGWEFSGVEELNWNTLNALQVLNLYLTRCINTSSDLSTELAISRFYDLMEDNMPWFERLLKEANRVAYPASSSIAEQRLALRRLDLIRSSALTEEEVICWRRFLYNIMVRVLEVLGWVSTDSSDFTFFLSSGSSLSINIKEILLLPSNFLHKVFELRSLICNINSLESQEMIKLIKDFIYKEESPAMNDSDSYLSLPSSPTVILNATEGSRKVVAQNIKEAFKAIYGNEWEMEESEAVPSLVSTPHHANEAEAEIPTASLTSAVAVHEAEAEASSKDKGKRPMTEEDEEKEQQIQLYAKQLDDLKVKIPAVYQIQEDEALALQLQEQFNKEEEEREKKKKEEAKFRITNSELAKEMREEWIEALISQGEDEDYLEKLSNKEIYRAFMGQQDQLGNKKRAEEEEKAKQKSKKTIAFNKRTHEERKVMIDFLKARGESGKRLGPMSFMNLQALYFKVKKEEGNKSRRRKETKETQAFSLIHHFIYPTTFHSPS
ncbi:hypothetical protein L1987_15461 [Smallanthus sonchifolius]|uniref:Uncharacterized protein n=1 Tax=Smallanthus sonchifolius TaxID=185202 RepID=A0ACB9J6G2_9ASTR|nr:hypothetical protein L1987_15461 [Smallanthus sonchifolius]